MKAKTARAQILMPKDLYRDLMRALKRRHAVDAVNGRESPTTLCGWVREKARETVAAYR